MKEFDYFVFSAKLSVDELCRAYVYNEHRYVYAKCSTQTLDFLTILTFWLNLIGYEFLTKDR